MKTSRLKNIVIVILLLVNAFLLFLLLSRRAEERDSNERRVEQAAVRLGLERDGLSVYNKIKRHGSLSPPPDI